MKVNSILYPNFPQISADLIAQIHADLFSGTIQNLRQSPAFSLSAARSQAGATIRGKTLIKKINFKQR